MSRRIAARMSLALAMIVAGTAGASAWGWDRCGCDDDRYGYYAPGPVYVYDHSRGPTWTSNGWSYPPVGVIYPVPPPHVPYAVPRYRGDDRDYDYRDRPRQRRTWRHW